MQTAVLYWRRLREPRDGKQSMKIEVLYFPGCPNHREALARVRQVLAEEGFFAEVLEVNVSEESMAQRVGFLGSPSIRVNGLDVEPEARAERAYGMMCRTYAVNGGREGLPSREMLRQAMREEDSVRGVARKR